MGASGVWCFAVYDISRLAKALANSHQIVGSGEFICQLEVVQGYLVFKVFARRQRLHFLITIELDGDGHVLQ